MHGGERMPFLIGWTDETRNPDYSIREIADTAAEARAAVERILTGYTWTPEEAEEIGGPFTEPALDALVRDHLGGDIDAGLSALSGTLTFRCDDGTLTVEPTGDDVSASPDAAGGIALFRRDMAAWLESVHRMTGRGTEAPTFAAAVAAVAARAREEVLADVAAGIVPVTVGSFSDLHDHVDANGYGGAFDWPCLPSEDRDDAYQTEFVRFWNAVQDSVHGWIASGRMREEAERPG